jgi:hypothetical protein
MSPFMALRDNSRRRSKVVAFGVKRTSKAALIEQNDEYTTRTTYLSVPRLGLAGTKITSDNPAYRNQRPLRDENKKK